MLFGRRQFFLILAKVKYYPHIVAVTSIPKSFLTTRKPNTLWERQTKHLNITDIGRIEYDKVVQMDKEEIQMFQLWS